MNNKQLLNRWTKEKSKELYNIKNWSSDYYSINENGEVTVTPFKRDDKTAVSLMDVVSALKDRGMDMPVLLRFENILDSQITFINNTFTPKVSPQFGNLQYEFEVIETKEPGIIKIFSPSSNRLMRKLKEVRPLEGKTIKIERFGEGFKTDYAIADRTEAIKKETLNTK